MTFPIFCMAHLLFGAALGFATERRMRTEGEVFSAPLLFALAPVLLVTAPLGALLLRYAGGWFSHGLFTGDAAITYERFFFGLVCAVSLTAALATAGAMVWVVSVLSHERAPLAYGLAGAAGVGIALTAVLDGPGIWHVMGADVPVYAHPAGWVSAAILAVFILTWLFARARFQAPAAA